jgi:tetratricopeptide (TPR) repeat protein
MAGAREVLERAIQADPNFPLAHSALATAWSSLGYDGRAREAAQRAFELSANLPRTDRLVVEGTYRQMASMWPEAIAIWETLRTTFPDDVEHTLKLAKAQTASGAAREGLATIESFRRQFPGIKDPRLDIAESRAAETLSDYKRMKSSAAAAAATAEAQGARLLVASANLCEGGAALRLRQPSEAIRLFESARNTFQAGGDRGGVAHALNNMAIAISDGPQIQRTRALYEEGLAIARAIGKQDLVARFLNNMAIQERHAGNFQVSLRMNQESLAIRREIGDRTNLAVSLNNIGNVLLDLGDLRNASQHYEEAAAMSREIGDRSSVARALYNAAECFRLQGKIPLARATNEESLRIRRGIDDPSSLATSLAGLGQVALVQGELAEAKALLSEAIEMDRHMDRRRSLAYSLFYLAEAALLEGDLGSARRLHLECLDLRTQLGEKGTAAESRTALAILAIEDGRPGDAEDLARAAAAAFEGQAASDNQAGARAAMALAMAAQGRQAQALHEVDRAAALVQNTQNVLVKLSVEIIAERIRGTVDPVSASAALATLHAQAVDQHIARSAFEAARALAQIENARSRMAGAERLANLRSEAQARGFGLYAR